MEIKFKAGDRTFLALSLEFELPASALAYANQIIKANPGLPTIVTTHGFLDLGGKRLGPANKAWSALTDENPQVFLILCGHMHGEAHRVDNNKAGLPVHQVLADYQSDEKGGNGYLRLLTSTRPRARSTSRPTRPTWTSTARRRQANSIWTWISPSGLRR